MILVLCGLGKSSIGACFGRSPPSCWDSRDYFTGWALGKSNNFVPSRRYYSGCFEGRHPLTDWWCYRCGVTRNAAVCPVCGLKAPSSFVSEVERLRSTLEELPSAVKSVRCEIENVHATLSEIRSALKPKGSSVLDWFGVLIFIFVLENWSGSAVDRWTDKAWYSVRYQAEFANITIEKRPPNCDFLHAPLGSKGCEYKKNTSIFGDEQRQALIRQATTAEDQQRYAKQPNAVTVYWEEEED